MRFIPVPNTQFNVIGILKIQDMKSRKKEIREQIDQYITENWERLTIIMMTKEINAQFGTVYSYSLIRIYTIQLGLTPITEGQYKIRFIKEYHKQFTIAEFAEKFQCQIINIKKILKELGLEAKPVEKVETKKAEKSKPEKQKVVDEESIEQHIPGFFEEASPELIEYVQGLLPKKNTTRPPAVYTQIGSPYGIASNPKDQDQ